MSPSSVRIADENPNVGGGTGDQQYERRNATLYGNGGFDLRNGRRPMTTIEARKIRNPWKRLRAGCYAIRFVASWRDDYPDQNTYYEGTLRVEHRDAEGNPLRAEDKKQGKPGDCVRASGDLYAVKENEARPAPQSIPIYPRDDRSE